MSDRVYLYAPEGFWRDQVEQPELFKKHVGGCGAGHGVGDWIVPDTLYLMSIKHACEIHDWMYWRGKTLADKEEADRVFLNNMYRIIKVKSANRVMRWLRMKRADKYYYMVDHFGADAFWHNKNRPETYKMIEASTI